MENVQRKEVRIGLEVRKYNQNQMMTEYKTGRLGMRQESQEVTTPQRGITLGNIIYSCIVQDKGTEDVKDSKATDPALLIDGEYCLVWVCH